MEPIDPGLRIGELDMLSQYLDFERATLLKFVDGLSLEQMRATLPPSDLTIAGLVKHLALVEDAWFTYDLAGEEQPEPWDGVDWLNDPDWEFRTALDDDIGTIVGFYEAACARSRAVVARVGDPAAVSVRGSRREATLGEPIALRWIMLHMIEETSRHLGHADLIRQSIDGATGL